MDLIQESAVEAISQVEYRALHPQELQTNRLLLRPFSVEDADGISACSDGRRGGAVHRRAEVLRRSTGFSDPHARCIQPSGAGAR